MKSSAAARERRIANLAREIESTARRIYQAGAVTRLHAMLCRAQGMAVNSFHMSQEDYIEAIARAIDRIERGDR